MKVIVDIVYEDRKFEVGDVLIGNSGIIVMYTGCGEISTSFSGVALINYAGWRIGNYNRYWCRNVFKPFYGTINITTS